MIEKDTTHDVTLYNVVFPIWALWLYPFLWLISLPANFFIDSAVLLLALKCLGISAENHVYKQTIIKIWGLGFAADFIGALWVALPHFASDFLGSSLNENTYRWMMDQLVQPVSYHPFATLISFLWVTVGVGLAAFLIYRFNTKISFKNLELEDKKKKRLALTLAIFTAPYLFYLPMGWAF